MRVYPASFYFIIGGFVMIKSIEFAFEPTEEQKQIIYDSCCTWKELYNRLLKNTYHNYEFSNYFFPRKNDINLFIKKYPQLIKPHADTSTFKYIHAELIAAYHKHCEHPDIYPMPKRIYGNKYVSRKSSDIKINGNTITLGVLGSIITDTIMEIPSGVKFIKYMISYNNYNEFKCYLSYEVNV